MEKVESKTKKIIFSAELFPPKKSGNLESVIRAMKEIKALNCDFVSITYGAGGRGGEGTADVASIAKDAFDIETVAHMTAVNLTRERLEEQLDMLQRKNIYNILVLRGDIVEDSKFYDFHHANELAEYIRENHPCFKLMGACYPEKHPEATSLTEDISYMKLKEDVGVTHFLSQLFFDNDKFYHFLDKVRAKGIKSPIEAGIMPCFSKKTITRMLAFSNASIPKKLQSIIDRDDDIYQAGLDYAVEQIDDLIKNGVDGIHLYTMNKGDIANYIFGQFKAFRGQ